MSEILVGRIILIIISSAVLLGIGIAKSRQRIGNNFFVIMLIFWTSALLVSIYPDILDMLLNSVGLDNRAQFLLILSVIIILYMLLQQTTKNTGTSLNLINIIREVAITNFQKEFQEKSDIVIVIVAKNESNSIGDVIENIKDVMKSHSYKILVVNDGSTDNTETIARQKGAFVINHIHNLGIGGATKTGYLASLLFKPDFIINIDADGQHNPVYIPSMISLLKEKQADLVYGSRFSKDANYKTTKIRSVGNKFYTLLVNKLAKISITDVNTGYRALRAEKLALIYFVSETNFAIELALRAGKNGLKVMEIPTHSSERIQGQSQFHKVEKFLIYNINVLKQIFRAYCRKPDEEILKQSLS